MTIRNLGHSVDCNSKFLGTKFKKWIKKDIIVNEMMS